MKIIIALLIFSLIIVIHEMGHFLLAKKNGIYVTEFSVGMGPRIVSFVKGETRYSLKLLPFGGSCMMLGEDEAIDDERAFGKKPVWARISVIAAGPIFNFILAFILALFIVGKIGYDLPIVSEVMEGYPAQEAGMQAGDKIIKINNEKINLYREVSIYVQLNQGKAADIVFEREGKEYNVTLVPQLDEETGNYLFGFRGAGKKVKGNAITTIQYSAYEVKYWIKLTIKSIGMIFEGKVTKDDVQGPVGMVNMIGDTYEESKREGAFYVWLSMLNISIILSANLGVMNLLPLPALDGGRLVFLIIEAIRGKPINQEKEGMVHFVGLMLLMALMILVMFNDIRRLF
ncbi:RIP metalloprotease RseP [Candidatus Galacturonibacter soehngenii]|uniref:Zinc metalloprotease n=1 Tax=Candidatus Galacturonatibacter soehngenii TaxID=2307010 RepID=A0A7V7QJA3_9FIRM|nr:RIP metalloprotease RseP [Candidatus Galacturonibacter soehngenii]KAB1437669.1 RIP metalloprotease RseP [Candidatus Galacturonibacter soehngenii]MBA4686897.1 RIP metalloprotease RseP [Candidatus Galacturonibacter soehngenii]